MGLRRLFLVIVWFVCILPLHAGWIDLNLENLPPAGFTEDAGSLMKNIAVSLGDPAPRIPDSNHRLNIGFRTNLFSPQSSRGLLPLACGSIAVSKNLTLLGYLSGFASGTDVIHISGYGMRLSLAEATSHPLVAALVLTNLKGAADFRTRSMQVGLTQWSRVFGLPIGVGLGYHASAASFVFTNDPGYPRTLKPTFFSLSLATNMTVGNFTVTPRVTSHLNGMVMSLEIARRFF